MRLRLPLLLPCLVAATLVTPAARAQVAPSASAVRALPTPLTLADAVAIALRQQPTEYLARTQITSANGQKAQARAQYFPTLTPTFQYQDTRDTFYGVPHQWKRQHRYRREQARGPARRASTAWTSRAGVGPT